MIGGLLLFSGFAVAATEEVVFAETLKEFEESASPETTVVAEVGGTMVEGNTANRVFRSNIDASYRWGWQRLTVDSLTELGRAISDADGDGTLSDSERLTGYQRTSEKGIDLRYDWYLNRKNALYGLAGWLRDPLSGYQTRVHGQVGYSRQWVDTEEQSLLGELGIDAAYERFVDGVDPLSARLYSARISVQWEGRFRDDLLLSQSIEAFVNVRNPADIRSISESAITFTATDMLSVRTSYLLNYDTVPVEGYRRTDQTIALTLVASMRRLRPEPDGPIDGLLDDDPS